MYVALENVAPDLESWNQYYSQELTIYDFDGSTNSYPTIRDVSDSKDADFSSITYFRGSATIRLKNNFKKYI